MSDPYLHPDPAHLRDLAARDPIQVQLYVRGLRSACIKAMVSALLRFVWRHIKQRFKASPQSTIGESYRLTSAAKALVANLTAMR